MGRTLSLLFVCLFLFGCVSLRMVKTYEGDLSREEIAVLQVPRFIFNQETLRIETIDGREINKVNPIVRLLPGDHSFVVSVSGYNNQIFAGSGPIELKFNARANHTYTLEYTSTFEGSYKVRIIGAGGEVVASNE